MRYSVAAIAFASGMAIAFCFALVFAGVWATKKHPLGVLKMEHKLEYSLACLLLAPFIQRLAVLLNMNRVMLLAMRD